ncbi:hypothetical protein [Salinibacterium sp. ZJ70]|uniref:hypothetical protein n=1 Tax=Salinibacterium sp. ZJ70 TaxID=2708084 RepID=UPI0014244D22|nr:hypothetical protein [Salinibacterium sp. ZJ70]
MSRIRGILTLSALGAALALGGCTPSSPLDRVLESSVDPAAPPSFLDVPQADTDIPPGDIDIADFGVVPDSLRYQGDWEGESIYLGVKGGSTVVVVRGERARPEQYGVSHSVGNTPFAIGSAHSEDRWLAYLPQGTGDVPEEAHPFSPHMVLVRS